MVSWKLDELATISADPERPTTTLDKIYHSMKPGELLFTQVVLLLQCRAYKIDLPDNYWQYIVRSI